MAKKAKKKTVKKSGSKRVAVKTAKAKGKKASKGRRAKRGPQGKRLANWQLITKSAVFEFLKSSKMSVASLAKTLGVSPGAVYAWKAGRRVPSEEAQRKLAKIVTGAVPVATSVTKTSRAQRRSAFSGSKLRTAREAQNLSRGAAAKRLGVSPSSLFNWESGKSVPRGKNLEKIQTFMGEGGGSLVAVAPQAAFTRSEKAVPEAVSGAAHVAAAYLAAGNALSTAQVVAFVRELRQALA